MAKKTAFEKEEARTKKVVNRRTRHPAITDAMKLIVSGRPAGGKKSKDLSKREIKNMCKVVRFKVREPRLPTGRARAPKNRRGSRKKKSESSEKDTSQDHQGVLGPVSKRNGTPGVLGGTGRVPRKKDSGETHETLGERVMLNLKPAIGKS